MIDPDGVVTAKAKAVQMGLLTVSAKMEAEEHAGPERQRFVRAGFKVVDAKDANRLFKRRLRVHSRPEMWLSMLAPLGYVVIGAVFGQAASEGPWSWDTFLRFTVGACSWFCVSAVSLQASATAHIEARMWGHGIPKDVLDAMYRAKQHEVDGFVVTFPGWPRRPDGSMEFAGQERMVMGFGKWGTAVDVARWVAE